MATGAEEMKAPLTKQYFAVLFVTIIILSLAPTLAHADQQPQPETISLNMTGQATAMGSGLSGASTLNLTADAYKNSSQWLIIQNATGSLQIGSTVFQITGGQRSVSKSGAVAIFADTNSEKKDQLILHGTMNGQTLTFDSPQSQLASTSYLSLWGTINENTGPIGNFSANPANTDENFTSLTTGLRNDTQTANSTATLVEPQNTTNTQSVNMTSTTHASSTLSTTLNNSTGSTIPTSGNAAPSTGTQAPANITVTRTQYLNQTISVTQTVANVTITYTVTSTVANTTITQTNMTTTVNATITITTSTGP
jgi:hypothetical protein